jgi:hypothetical protein
LDDFNPRKEFYREKHKVGRTHKINRKLLLDVLNSKKLKIESERTNHMLNIYSMNFSEKRKANVAANFATEKSLRSKIHESLNGAQK